MIEKVTDWLYNQERMQRRPEATAKLLVLVCNLYRRRIPWPTRPAVAQALGVSMPLIDVAISQRRAQKLIEVVIETKQGHVKQRASVITEKYIEPCAELLKVVEDAEKEEARIKRRKPKHEIAVCPCVVEDI